MESLSEFVQLKFVAEQFYLFCLFICLLEKIIQNNSTMEKNIGWQRINYKNQDDQAPIKRWGHKMVQIDHELVLFGGFSDVTYLDDLWAYNIHTNQWRRVQTTGQKPEGKSNFTMHFDKINNQLILFGGGGPNKKRFNKISILNWQNKVWTEYENNNQNSPWQRTYHSSQFKYPYLITFGGEGAANIDFDDLWAFNIETKEWKQLKSFTLGEQNSETKIQGRRFHTTGLIGYELYIISGCKANYVCIPNIYSVDLKELFTHKDNEKIQIKWKQHKFSQKQLQLIERWGHSSEVYEGKIYIFGGRNKDDYNDIIEFDPVKGVITKLSPHEDYGLLPESRRRHSSTMIGSSMVIFGGFNLAYFSDMHYISLFECRDSFANKYCSLQQQLQMIELEQTMFQHFLQEINKDKPEYDIQICIEHQKSKESLTIKSISSLLSKQSPFLCNCIKYVKNYNPERKNINIILNQNISFQSFIIFNAYLIKDLLILPKDSALEIWYQLIFCADYFASQKLLLLCQKALSRKVVLEKENLDDIFNIAANWRMPRLLKLCTEKKITNRNYFSNKNEFVPLTATSSRLKDRYIEEMLIQIQFDEIQKGKNKRNQQKLIRYGEDIKQINLLEKKFISQSYEKNDPVIVNKRKKSFVQVFFHTFTKICCSSHQNQEPKQRPRSQTRVTLEQQQLHQINRGQSSSQGQIKMF